MRHLRVRRPVLLLAALWFALYRDHSGLVRVGLLAALLHECGHVAVWLALTRSLPVLRLSVRGVGLDVSGVHLSRRQAFVLALAGPLTNFALCAGTLAKMQLRASYWGYFFAAANLATGLFNLLPVGDLDGRRLLQSLWP
ncbi:MAG TPA: M50 family metallopeptidase [Candidatus Fournierella merdavium]|uniref:peptidase n=1 Tax=Candidatus Allofournierella merdavium TaxID=2838593 RepID=UPI001F9354B0|nr:M50 family metallopeptidase [Candidatus Fournierella merdavium]